MSKKYKRDFKDIVDCYNHRHDGIHQSQSWKKIKERVREKIIRQRLSWSNEENKGKRREDGGSFTCFPHTVFILILHVIARPIPAEMLTWKKRRAACMRGWRSVNPLPAAGGSPFFHWFFTLLRYPLIPLSRNCRLFRVISTVRPPISIDFDHRSAFNQLIMPFNTSTLSSNAFLSQVQVVSMEHGIIDLKTYQSTDPSRGTPIVWVIDCSSESDLTFDHLRFYKNLMVIYSFICTCIHFGACSVDRSDQRVTFMLELSCEIVIL